MRRFNASIPMGFTFTDGRFLSKDSIIMDNLDPTPVLIGFDVRTLPIGTATFRRREKFLDVKLKLIQDQPDGMVLTFSGQILAFENNLITAFEIKCFNYMDAPK